MKKGIKIRHQHQFSLAFNLALQSNKSSYTKIKAPSEKLRDGCMTTVGISVILILIGLIWYTHSRRAMKKLFAKAAASTHVTVNPNSF